MTHLSGDLEKAKGYYHLALDIKREQLVLNYVDVSDSFINVGTVCSDTGDLEKDLSMGTGQ